MASGARDTRTHCTPAGRIHARATTRSVRGTRARDASCSPCPFPVGGFSPLLAAGRGRARRADTGHGCGRARPAGLGGSRSRVRVPSSNSPNSCSCACEISYAAGGTSCASAVVPWWGEWTSHKRTPPRQTGRDDAGPRSCTARVRCMALLLN